MSRNVVLITIDSLRADHCGFMGYDKDTTPTLDSMAQEGTVFTNAIAPGAKTPESMPAIFTGLYPSSDTDKSGLASWKDRIFPHVRSHDTIQERFSRQGYETVAFTPNTFTSAAFGFDKGFDHFEDFLDKDIRPGMDFPNVLRGLFKWLRHEGNWKRWEKYYDEIIQTMEDVSEPYFLWVFLLDVHAPYLVPSSYRTENSWFDMVSSIWQDKRGNSNSVHQRLVSAYDDTIRYADEFIRRLQKDLTDTNPVFVVHADHGEAFGEHGLYGHELHLYQENIHVPLVVWNTGLSKMISEPFSLRQLPELLVYASLGDKAAFKSWLNSSITTSPVISQSKGGKWKSINTENHKMIINDTGAELYELSSDPKEVINSIDDHPHLAKVLWEGIHDHEIHQQELANITQACQTQDSVDMDLL